MPLPGIGYNGQRGWRGAPRVWLPVLLWMAIIFFLSAQPDLPCPQPLRGSWTSVAGHLGEYGVLALLLYRALCRSLWSESAGARRQIAALAFVLALLYGLSDEWHQSFVPGRTATLIDLGYDALGAVVGVAIAGIHGGSRTM